MKFFYGIFLFSLFCVQAEVKKPRQRAAVSKNFLQILDLPLEKRLGYLRKNSSRSFSKLSVIFKSKKYSDELKWKALMAMTRLDSQRAQPYIRQSLRHRSWYFKNAGLIALEIFNPQMAVAYARRFLDHPSLILRTASVDVIRRQRAYQYRSLLKEKLYAKENYRNDVSLWIRPRIVQTLSEFSNANDQSFFTALLDDSDVQVQAIALKTLQYMDLLSEQKPQVAREGFEPPTHGL